MLGCVHLSSAAGNSAVLPSLLGVCGVTPGTLGKTGPVRVSAEVVVSES